MIQSLPIENRSVFYADITYSWTYIFITNLYKSWLLFSVSSYLKTSYTIISYMILSFLPSPPTALPGSAPVLLLFRGEKQDLSQELTLAKLNPKWLIQEEGHSPVQGPLSRAGSAAMAQRATCMALLSICFTVTGGTVLQGQKADHTQGDHKLHLGLTSWQSNNEVAMRMPWGLRMKWGVSH